MEDSLYRESTDRRSAEQEVYDLSAELANKEMSLLKERKANCANANRIEIMNLELAEVKEEQERLVEENKRLEETVK